MGPAANRRLVERINREIWNARWLQRIPLYYSEDFARRSRESLHQGQGCRDQRRGPTAMSNVLGDVAMGWVDAVMLAVLLLSVIVGVVRGLVFEMLSVAGWFAAYFAAQWAAPEVAPMLPVGAAGSKGGEKNAVGVSSSAGNRNTYHPFPSSIRLVPECWWYLCRH